MFCEMTLTDESHTEPSNSWIALPFIVILADDSRHDHMWNAHSDTSKDGKLTATHLVQE